MSKRYTLRPANGEDQTFSKKDIAIRAGERIGEPFQVLSPSGALVYDTNPGGLEGPPAEETPELAEETPELADETPEEDEDLIGDVTPEPVVHEASGSHAFPGNYSIAFIPFAQTLADAMGGLETSVEKPGGLTRVFHFAGSKQAVQDFEELLNDSVPATLDGLHTWQKEHRAERKGLTDMQKFLQHREYIERTGRTIAEGL